MKRYDVVRLGESSHQISFTQPHDSMHENRVELFEQEAFPPFQRHGAAQPWNALGMSPKAGAPLHPPPPQSQLSPAAAAAAAAAAAEEDRRRRRIYEEQQQRYVPDRVGTVSAVKEIYQHNFKP